MDQIVDNFHTVAGYEVITYLYNDGQKSGARFVKLDTGIRISLYETVVDKGIVLSFVPDTRSLANSLNFFVMSADLVFTTRDLVAFGLTNVDNFLDDVVEKCSGEI